MTPNRKEQPCSREVPRQRVGQAFNPWYKACGFYPPDFVGRQRDLTDGQKRLYERAVRWSGRNGSFWRSYETIAAALGKSVRQVKSDMATLENKGFVASFGIRSLRVQCSLLHITRLKSFLSR